MITITIPRRRSTESIRALGVTAWRYGSPGILPVVGSTVEVGIRPEKIPAGMPW
jgi:hypothetical protein